MGLLARAHQVVYKMIIWLAIHIICLKDFSQVLQLCVKLSSCPISTPSLDLSVQMTCKVFSGLTTYFLLVPFAWFLAEAIFMNIDIRRIATQPCRIRLLLLACCFCWRECVNLFASDHSGILQIILVCYCTCTCAFTHFILDLAWPYYTYMSVNSNCHVTACYYNCMV